MARGKKANDDIIKVDDDFKAFKKPASDYYRLDVVVRKTAKTDRGYNVVREDIDKDYRKYLKMISHKNETTIAKYLQKLIEEDAKAHNYKL